MTLKINGATGGSVSLDAPDNTSPAGTDVTLTLPTTAGSSGQYLQTNGTGTLSWQTVASDAITEGNTNVEAVDTGTDGHVKVVTEGTDALRVDSSQRVLIRTTGTFDSGTADIVHIAGTAGSNVLLGREATGINGGNNLGQIRYYGQHGGTWRESARIQVTADGGHSTSSRPGKISFLTTTAGSNSPSEQMSVDGNGDLAFNSGYGSVATAYGVRAWVEFDGGGTPTIRSSGNVSSITDNATGSFYANFSNSMPDVHYVGSGHAASGLASGNYFESYVWPNNTSRGNIRTKWNGTDYDVDRTGAIFVR